MPVVDHNSKALFRRDGVIKLDAAITPELLNMLRLEFDAWVARSRQYSAPFGLMMDGRPRFDVEPGHCAERPALRRVASPTELSDAYLSVVRDSRIISAIAELIGSDLRFHHSKVNSKLPGAKTSVKWHQDFAYDPHSNDDLITVILLLNDVTEENGPPKVVPGSHKGPLRALWHAGVFTGAVGNEIAEQCEASSVSCIGQRGSAFLMHTRLAHASAENGSSSPRTLFIFNIGAADAVPLAPCAVPSIHQGMIVHGKEPNRVRCTPFELQTPEVPTGASFFTQQAGR